jgi:hypothetical protein
MKTTTLIVSILLGSCSLAFAQSSSGAAGSGSSAGAASSGAATGAGGSPGGTLSDGSTVNGTGGSPGANTSNALNHRTTGNNFGGTSTAPTASQGAPSTGNAVNTHAANQAQQSLGSTDTGILKK